LEQPNLRILISLANKSLIRRDADTGRYGIHELLRQYAEEHLQLSGEMTNTKTKHSTFFTELVIPLGDTSVTENEATTLSIEINPDFENVRAAWQFHIEHKNLTGLQQLLNGIWMFLEHVNHPYVGIAICDEAVDVFEHDNSANAILLRAQVLAKKGWFQVNLAPYRENAHDIFQQVLPILKQFEAVFDQLMVYSVGSVNLHLLGRSEEQLDMAIQGYDLSVDSGDIKWRPTIEFYIMQAYYELDRYDDALQWIQSLSEERQQEYANIYFMGRILFKMGKDSKAKPYLLKAEEMSLAALQSNPTQHHYRKLRPYRELIEINVCMNNHQQAIKYLAQVLQLTDNIIYPDTTLEILEVALDIFIAVEDYEKAIEISSLIVHHPAKLGLSRNRALKHQEMLRVNVSTKAYNAVWERGKSLDLDTVVQELITEMVNSNH
jgi:tetratricopeptide (TPR) repeat protein